MFCRERQQPGGREHLGMILRSAEAEQIKDAASTLCDTVLGAVLTWWMTARPSGGLSGRAKRSACESRRTLW